MNEKEFRVAIKHYFMKGKTPQETKEKLDKYYGDSAPSIRIVWFQNFRSVHMGTSNAERSGRPVEVTTQLSLCMKLRFTSALLKPRKTQNNGLSRGEDNTFARRDHGNCRLAHKKVLFHHDNAPVQTSSGVVAKSMEIGFQLISHPYSPNLAPSDYY